MRPDGRRNNQLREVTLEPNVSDFAEGSCLSVWGKTRVLCTASVEQRVPRWFENGENRGWITAEYAMLPRSNRSRSRRDGRNGVSGRTLEIQRLIGRSLRGVTDLSKMPGLTITVDCDVIQADGGTRTASVTGAFVALAYALQWCKKEKLIETMPLIDTVAGVSVGIVDGQLCLDLEYAEDSVAEVDANFVITGRGGLIEVQGTAEGAPFSDQDLNKMLTMAKAGCKKLKALQGKVIVPKLIIRKGL